MTKDCVNILKGKVQIQIEPPKCDLQKCNILNVMLHIGLQTKVKGVFQPYHHHILIRALMLCWSTVGQFGAKEQLNRRMRNKSNTSTNHPNMKTKGRPNCLQQ